jgi:hypothetical protein
VSTAQSAVGCSQVVTWMTCALDTREHAVTDADFAAGLPHGLYKGVCGYLVVPQALVSPPGRACALCTVGLGEGGVVAAHRGSRIERACRLLAALRCSGFAEVAMSLFGSLLS